MDVQICAVDHIAIVRAYFSLIRINLQVCMAHFDVFLSVRIFGALLRQAVPAMCYWSVLSLRTGKYVCIASRRVRTANG
jgi:hypothetical protein